MEFVKPPLEFLRSIIDKDSESKDIALDVYCSEQYLFRVFFWMRLWMLTLAIRRFSKTRGVCLDFGGGSGIFTASLSSGFDRVHLIDLNTEQANQVKRKLGLKNISIVTANVSQYDYGEEKFDAIVAADVLEHFEDLKCPIEKIYKWIGKAGYLYTSLPTENVYYNFLRKVFNKQKPEDHYHSAAEVEDFLKSEGFKKVCGYYHPLFIPIFPLFRISVWQKI
jgi:2-polyprenyl-3-methyl-5-hydroxy-6-metoxy-1,4-benzoquinol methylase